MRAVVFDDHGDESVLRVDEIDEPRPGRGEVLIEVAAAGVNRADLLQRRGFYPPPPGASEVLGLECAGSIRDIGPGVSDFEAGDRVMALLTGGGYAERVVAPGACVMRTPDRLTDSEAAATPEVFLTAFLNLFLIGGIEEGQTALVHGGSGGVGSAAIQLIRDSGARVIATAGSDERTRRCLELGADQAWNYHEADFVQATTEATDDRGLEVILDCIGAKYLSQHLEMLAVGGRLVIIGLQGGAKTEIDLSRLLKRRISIVGSTLRSRSAADKGQIIRQFLEQFGPSLDRGTVGPVIDRTFRFDEAARAHRALAAGEVFGKLVLTPN